MGGIRMGVCDGIGRHARFRFSCGDACGFKSRQTHHCRQNLRLTIVIRRFCLFGGIALKWMSKISYNHISQVSAGRFKEIGSLLSLLLIMFLESESIMKLPYGYILNGISTSSGWWNCPPSQRTKPPLP